MPVVSLFEMRPVGQGAFLRGIEKIYSEFPNANYVKSVRWIYDCGVQGKQCVLNNSINAMAVEWPPGGAPEKPIDVLVISHFDQDHISGLPLLLKQYRFERVFMPQYSRLERLAVGLFKIEDADQEVLLELLFFLDDPAEYIMQRSPPGRTTLVLVEPAGDSPIGLSPEIDTRGSQGDRDGYEMQDPSMPADPNASNQVTRLTDDALTSGSGKVAVNVVASGAPFIWVDQWELVPYVDEEASKKFLSPSDKIRKELDAQLELLLENARKPLDKNQSHDDKLKAIKVELIALRDTLYQEMAITANVAAITAPNKNGISLMAYMGPTRIQFASTHVRQGDFYDEKGALSGQLLDLSVMGSGVLLTGDANLKGNAKVDRLEAFMGKQRTRTVAVFQVPHHGSQKDSDPYTSARLGAPFNLVNANPGAIHKHPDAQVVTLFQKAKAMKGPPGPVHVALVNKHGFEAVGFSFSPHHLWTACLGIHHFDWNWHL